MRSGTAAFPELVAAAVLPYGVVLDGEVVIWADGPLAFEYLTRRLNRRPVTAARLAEEHPARSSPGDQHLPHDEPSSSYLSTARSDAHT